jgi:hypothetical protein
MAAAQGPGLRVQGLKKGTINRKERREREEVQYAVSRREDFEPRMDANGRKWEREYTREA